MEVRARSAARSWNICKYMYISYVNIRSLRQQVILEAPIEGVRDEAEWDGFFPDTAAGIIAPGFTKHQCSPHPGHLHALPQHGTG